MPAASLAPVVVAVTPGSPADAVGMLPGDEVVSLDGTVPRDIIEWRLLTDASDVEIDVRRGGVETTVVVQKATRRVAGRGRSARSEHGVSRAIACRMGITRAGVRTFHCANSLQAGTWDLTTEARNGSTVIARVTRSMTLRAQARLPVTG